MADADTFGVELKIDVGADTATARKNLADFEQQCKDLGKTAEETKNHLITQLKEIARFTDPSTGELNEKGNALIKLFDKDQAEKAAKAASDAAKKNLQDAQREIAKLDKQLRGMGKMLGNPFEFLSAKGGLNLGGFLMRMGRASSSVAPFANIFNNYRAVWNFVDGIAQLNKEIMRLSYTSGMGAGELKNLGNAAAAFGGSAATIAAGNERFVKTVEDMKRGGGMGFLGTIAYKYGFMADLGADWQTNTQRAIEMARGMDVNTRMAFLKDFDSSNYKQNMAYASMDETKYNEYMSRMNTPEKSEAAQGAATATQDFLMSTNELSSAWQYICDQIAEVLLPIMTKIVDCVAWLLETIGPFIGGLTKIIALVGTLLALWKTGKIIYSAINAIRAKGIALQIIEGMQTKKNTALTWLGVVAELAKTFAKNPIMGAVAIAGVAAIAGAGAAYMFNKDAIDKGKEAEKKAAQEKYEAANISLTDVVSGKRQLTPLEKWAFGINNEMLIQNAIRPVEKEQDAAIMGLDAERTQNAGLFNDSLKNLSDAADKTAEALGYAADAARDTVNDISREAMTSQANQIFSRTIENSSVQTNINMENTFNEATSEAMEMSLDQMTEFMNANAARAIS